MADRDRGTPPFAPETGARHIVAVGANGDWAGQSGKIAICDGAAWLFETPLPGWRAYCLAEATDLTFGGDGWESRAERPLEAARMGSMLGRT